MAKRSPRQVEIPLHLLRLPISAGDGGSNLTRLHNVIRNNEAKGMNDGASKKDRVRMARRRIRVANCYDYPQYYDIAFQAYTEREADFIEAACRKYCSFDVR